MLNYLYNKLLHHFHNPDYRYFTISLILMIVIPSIAPLSQAGHVVLEVTYGFVILIAAIFTSCNFRELVLFLILGSLAYILFLGHSDEHFIRLVRAGVTTSFFGLVFWNLVRFILRTKEVDANVVLACVSGYLVLGIVAAPLFFIIEDAFSGSFQIEDSSNFYNFLYFSYITLTTVGYGDILPISSLAKSIAVLLSLLGQLYLTIIVALIIGKYLANER